MLKVQQRAVMRDYVREFFRRRDIARGTVDPVPDFGPPSTYSLTTVELAAHIRQLRGQGWQPWEIITRFDFGRAA